MEKKQFDNLEEKITSLFDGESDFKLPGLTGKHILILIFICFGIYLAMGIFIVGPDERGVVRRFGKLHRIVQAGLHYHLPFPFETVNTPKVDEIKRMEIGFETVSSGSMAAKYRDIPQESLMLTGDENIIDLDIIVQYKIKDPPSDYLFNVRDIRGTIHNASEAALRQAIGNHGVDEALTEGKSLIQQETRDILQIILDAYNVGVQVEAVQLQDVHPPKEVIKAFKDVASAKEDKERLQNEAQGYRNSLLPRTKGEAEKLIRESEAYKAERVNQAKGNADRFLSILKEYQTAKEVTEIRLYIETMEEVMKGCSKYIIDTEAGAALLNLLQSSPSLGASGKGGAS